MAIDRTAAHGQRHRAGGSDWLPVSAPARLLGRGSSGAGAMQEVTLGPGLSMEGTTLSATGGGGGGGTPDAHHATHELGGTDPVTLAQSQVTGLTSALGGKVDTTDPRLTDARTPTAHAPTHQVGGSDPLSLLTLGGYPGGTTTYLRGDGSFAAPPGTSPAGSTTQVQFNDGGVFGGDSGLTFDKATDALSVGGLLTVNGFGNNAFSASGVGFHTVDVRNTQAGSPNGAILRVGNDLTPYCTQVVALSSSYSSAGRLVADGTSFEGNGAGGVSVAAMHASGVLRFYTGGVERARIDPAGQLFIGTTSITGGYPTRLGVAAEAGTYALICLQDTYAPAGGTLQLFVNAAGAIAGSITHPTATTVAYNTTSDQRLKTDRGRATDLTGLRGVVVHDFAWKVDGLHDRGVFAQEAHAVFPRAITAGTGGTDVSKPWMTDYSKFVPDLIIGWQQHDAALTTLAARLAALEQRI